MQERMSTIREELTQKHKSELCVLRDEFVSEKADLKKALEEENNRLRSLQAALEADNSKNQAHSLEMNLAGLEVPHSF